MEVLDWLKNCFTLYYSKVWGLLEVGLQLGAANEDIECGTTRQQLIGQYQYHHWQQPCISRHPGVGVDLQSTV